MGNKQSGVEKQKDEESHESAQEGENIKEVTPQHFALDQNTKDISKATVEDLTGIGLPEELAGKLALQGNKGKLKSVSDVVVVLENSGKSCKVEFDEEFFVKIDSSGRVVIERKVLEPAKKKRSFSLRWSRSAKAKSEQQGDTSVSELDQEQQERSEKKRASFKFSWSIQKRSKSSKKDQETESDRAAIKENEVNFDDQVNINTATEEELEVIKGIGPEVAKRIVAYREEHGPFHEVEELSVVRGVSKRLLKNVATELTVGNVGECGDQKVETHMGPKFKLNAVSSGGSLKHKGRDIVRLLSWNLQCFNEDKASNEGVREVICRTILESGVSIAAFQEIADEEALIKIKDELNNPTLKGVKKSKGQHGHWECITSDVAGTMFRSREYNGFLWNTSRDIELKSSALLEKPKKGKKQFARRPFLGFFKANRLDFVVVSVHLKATGFDNEDISRLQKELGRIPDIITAINDQIPGEKDMIIAGDFNLNPDEKEFDSFRESGLTNLIPDTMLTNISMSNMDGSKCYDNIWVSDHAKDKAYSGRAGVIRDGMSNPKIPDGWKWGGVVSDHCPVWAEFYCDRDTDQSTGEENVEDITIATE